MSTATFRFYARLNAFLPAERRGRALLKHRMIAHGCYLHAVKPAAQLQERLPPRVRERHTHFVHCERCAKLYWEGSHWQDMRALLVCLGIIAEG